MAVQRAIDQRLGVAPVDPANAAGAVAPRGPGANIANTVGAVPVGQAGEGGAPRQRSAAAAPSRARVSAVVLADRPGRDAALLDGRIAYVGDKVAGGTVSRIDSQGVTLKDAKGRLSLVPLIVRTPTASEVAADAASAATGPAPVSPPSGAPAPGKELP